jgi:hypothetical protein
MPDPSKIFGPFDRGDGQPIYADPTAVLRRLWLGAGGKLHEVMEKARGEDSDESWQAQDTLVAAARPAFGLVPFDPLTGQSSDDHALDVLDEFNAWYEKKNLIAATEPTSPPSTAPTS